MLLLPASRRAIPALAIRAAALATLALTGCTNTTAINPDQLPVVTETARRDPREPVDVLAPEVLTARLEGRLDAVQISMMGWGKAYDRFDAPIVSRTMGPWLIVQDQEKGRV